jgi:hypothetical protein
LHGRIVDQRADLGRRLAGISDAQRARSRRQLLGQRIRDRTIDHDPLGGHADLTLMEERTEARCGCRPVQVGVCQHHHRCLSAELEQDPLEMAPGCLGDDPSHLAGAGEVDPTRCGVGDQLLHHIGGIDRIVGDQIDDSRRQTGVIQRARDRRMRARAQLRGLQHDGVPISQRRGDRTRGEDHRRVPRCDRDHDAGWLADSHRQLSGHV